MPPINLMRHLKARGGPLGVGQKRQDDGAEAGGRFNQVLTYQLVSSAPDRRLSPKYIYTVPLILETGSVALERRPDRQLHDGCSAARLQRSKVQQPGPIPSTDGMMSTSPRLYIFMCSAALARTGSFRRCAKRGFTFRTIASKRSELLAEHVGSTDRRTEPSLRLLLAQEIASIIMVQALTNTSLHGLDRLTAFIMLLVSAIRPSRISRHT